MFFLVREHNLQEWVRNCMKTIHSQKNFFENANDILGFKITNIMFEGSKEELTQTKVTQPAIFLHSVILAKAIGERFTPDMVAGHSLGEFSALTAANYLRFEDGLKLVYKRALAMQKACETNPSTMAAILGLEDAIVEDICESIDGIVVPANYNCPGQLVISGSNEAIELACQKLTEAGARRALKLAVGGAFHSPLMESARTELASAIETTPFGAGHCPIYQNTTAKAESNPEQIKLNLNRQLTSPVRWTQTMEHMKADGLTGVIEVGPGKFFKGCLKKWTEH